MRGKSRAAAYLSILAAIGSWGLLLALWKYSNSTTLLLPEIAILLLTASLAGAMIWLIGSTLQAVALFWIEHCRIPPDLCQRCRYDLTGNTSGVCPECGERI